MFSEPTLETQQAAGLIGDAEKCKLLLSSLHETTARLEEREEISNVNSTLFRRDDTCPIAAKLQQISTELHSFLLGE